MTEKPFKPELATHPTADCEDVVTKLEQVLALAKEGVVTDFVMFYLRRSDPEPWIKHSYSKINRLRIIGALEIMKSWLCGTFDCVFEMADAEETDSDVDPEQ